MFPDRAQITMTVPFMRAYTNLLVKTCHSRGAHAIGGMAAFIPSRRDADINEMAFAKVREDKEREATDGFDGTGWPIRIWSPFPTRSLARPLATSTTRNTVCARMSP